jgi:hypothetical protein
LFKPSGSFTEATNLLCKRASKAIFCIRKLLFSENNNILPHIKLFETCVISIILYCIEVWSLNISKDNKIIESKYWNTVKIQIKFTKYLIGVNKVAVNAAVLAELGMYPVSMQALKLSISFWLHVLNSGENSLVSAAYKASLLLPNGFAKKN